MRIPRVCVIGAGPTGLSALIQLKQRQDEGKGPFDITCFESQPTFGGNWNLTWRTGYINAPTCRIPIGHVLLRTYPNSKTG